MQTTYMNTAGNIEYRHETGEISHVKIDIAGMGRKRIRIANLPPETPDTKIRQTMAKFGEITEITEEQWSKTYRYSVSNGIRIATIHLTQHIPSIINIDGIRVLISYEGQPMTCFGCGETGHQFQNCKHRRNQRQQSKNSPNTTWADIIQRRTGTNPQNTDEGESQIPNEVEHVMNLTQKPQHKDYTERHNGTQKRTTP
jgi:hypothetical protein